MALIVEDGTGVSNAVSYCTITYAVSYHSARGNSSWASASLSDQESSLVRATDYIEQRFSEKFSGLRASQEQSLSWPRTDARTRDGFDLPENAIPDVLQRACAEYALRALSSSLTPDITTGVSGTIKRQRSKVGPIEEETEYVDGGVSTALPVYPAVDRIIRNILLPGAGTVFR